MVFEIYISRLIIYCVIALVLGAVVAFFTIQGNADEGYQKSMKKIDVDTKMILDFFLVFKQIKLVTLFEMIWLPIVSFFALLGINLEILDPKKK
ncbi:MAG: hypothetical protein U0469_00980 [Candidatus Paceibacterota bacterium]